MQKLALRIDVIKLPESKRRIFAGSVFALAAAFSSPVLSIPAPQLDVPKTTSIEVVLPNAANITISPGATTARVTWMTANFTKARLIYGTSRFLEVDDTGTVIMESRSNSMKHSLILTSLEPGQTYYLTLESQDPSGRQILASSQTTFTTHSE